MEIIFIIGLVYAVLGFVTKITNKMNNSLLSLNKFMLGGGHSLLSFMRGATEDLWTVFKKYSEEQTGPSYVIETSNVKDRVLFIAKSSPKFKDSLTNNNEISFSLIPYILKNKNVGFVPRLLSCAYVSFKSVYKIALYIFAFSFLIVIVAMRLENSLGLPANWADQFAGVVGGFMFLSFLFFFKCSVK